MKPVCLGPQRSTHRGFFGIPMGTPPQCQDIRMNQSSHPWADEEMSASLPRLSARGEGQGVEFKESLPEQAHDIGKSIAAFSSSNDGLLLYGVTDRGEIVGLACAEDAKWRDGVQQRVLNAARGVRPPVHPTLVWAVHGEKIVCIVKIAKGPEPIYYSNHRPILRRGVVSRPAEPGEVEQVFRQRYASSAGLMPTPSTKSIGRRMQQVLDLMNAHRYALLTVVDLARAMEFALPTELEAVVEGHVPPSFALLDQFCARFAVDKEWLETGRGEPFRSPKEYRNLPEDYLAEIDEARPQSVYLVRSKSPAGESFVVVQIDELRSWCLPSVWHVSDHVGGGGSRDLLRLFDLFRSLYKRPKPDQAASSSFSSTLSAWPCRPSRKSTARCAWAAAEKMARLSSLKTLSQFAR